jgi:hypothetical protein
VAAKMARKVANQPRNLEDELHLIGFTGFFVRNILELLVYWQKPEISNVI